jgi:hypothetical protein
MPIPNRRMPKYLSLIELQLELERERAKRVALWADRPWWEKRQNWRVIGVVWLTVGVVLAVAWWAVLA